MRFEIEANPRGGLKVIREIPDVGPICQIEGRNGVGKSMALRLLELCTGTQPYDGDIDSWTTLKKQLGPVIVRALALADDQSVEWRLNPAVWPERPDAVGPWLGTVEIDGRQATLEEAYALIRVIHHSGDLTLEGAIRERIGRDRNAVRTLLDRFTDRERGIGEHLDVLRRDLDRADYQQLQTLQTAVDEARAQASEVARGVESVRAARVSIERALALREQQQRLVDDVPELEERERELDGQIEAARERVRRVEARYDEMRAQRRRDEAVVEEIERVEGLLKGRVKRAENARERVARLAAESRLPANNDEVAAALATVREERDRLVRERDLIDATPRVRQLIDELSARLETRRAHELDEQVVARLGQAVVSVRELRQGVEARRAEFSDYEPEPPAAVLETQIRMLNARTAALTTLQEALDKAQSSQRLVDQGQAELAALTAQLPADEAAEYRQIEEELSEARNEHLALVERRALIRGQITEIVGGGAESGARELTDLLGALGTAAPDLDGLLVETGRELDERIRGQALAASPLADAQRQLQLARAEFDQAVAVLERGDDYGWLRADGIELPDSTLGDEENGRCLTRLKTAVHALEARFDAARDTLRGVDGGLAAWEARDRLGERGTPYASAVRGYYEQVFGQEFSGREIVDAIFDGGEFGSLDMSAMAVTWKTDEGELRTRPLAAFSSGERAFAYTRTRLQSIDERAKNRVVALDEFGAFLARDRLAQLVTFLEHEVLGSIADEVIIVLPLLRDYESELDQTVGALHDELAERVDELKASGYFSRSPDWSTV